MISIADALKIIAENVSPVETEIIELPKVCGRVLAEEIRADMDLPPFDRSQMDGYAIRVADAVNAPVKLKIIGESAAGAGWRGNLKAGEAVRIMTGAPVPTGADAVQKLELANEENGFVEILEPVKIGQNIVQRASEIEAGTRVFESGEIVNAAMIASLASFGCARVKVARKPRVSILATGSELVPIEQKPAQDQIRNSNSLTLKFYADKCGATCKILRIAGDEIENLKAQIENAVETSDVLILSGGVSVGKYDFTKTALRELGAEILFERVALRPGKPTVFGRLNNALIFGLPGNPVSAIVTFNLFVRSALLQMQRASSRDLKSGFAVSGGKFKGTKGRDSLLPGRLTTNEKGQLIAENLRWGGSSDFIGFARAEALVFVPQGETIEAGEIVKIAFLP
ncbi:MAG: molybdopterin molybdotransferase MoeA [Acidobacteriota bacterium]|nr:molybdopterin molybdotransferase MoeA [Acidobacteriota bacterium]